MVISLGRRALVPLALLLAACSGSDSSGEDAAVPDADTVDGDLDDAPPPDAEEPDAEVPDAEVPDAEVPDADSTDAGPIGSYGYILVGEVDDPAGDRSAVEMIFKDGTLFGTPDATGGGARGTTATRTSG